MTGQRERKLEYVADATGLYRVEPDQATGSDLLIRIDYPPGPAKALRVVVPMMPGYGQSRSLAAASDRRLGPLLGR